MTISYFLSVRIWIFFLICRIRLDTKEAYQDHIKQRSLKLQYVTVWGSELIVSDGIQHRWLLKFSCTHIIKLKSKSLHLHYFIKTKTSIAMTPFHVSKMLHTLTKSYSLECLYGISDILQLQIFHLYTF